MSSNPDAPEAQPAPEGHHPAQPHHRHSHRHHRHRHHPGSHPAEPRRRRRIVWIVLAVLIVLIGGCVLLHHGPKKSKKPAGTGAITISTGEVKKGNINVTLVALGTVTPVYTVTVTSRVTGAITEVAYKEGQIVKKNDLLLVIDPRPFVAAVDQAEGQLARDQAALDNARLDLTRYEQALKVHAIPEQEVATQAALVREDEATVKLDQANVETAQLNLDYSHIRAPIDGRVGLRLVDPGNIVVANSTTALVTITQLQPITVIFTVAEDYLDQIVPAMRSGHPLRVDALDRTEERVISQGYLETIDNQINAATGTVRARAVFANAKNELFPNQFVNARLYIKTLSGVELVPTSAIQRNDTAAFVYVLQPNGTVKSTTVKVTVTEGTLAAVTGVAAGAQVVTEGFEKLQDGSKVRVRQPGSKPAAGNAPSGATGKKGKSGANGDGGS